MSNDPWKHRSAGMLCNTCMWYIPKESTLVGIGRCRRHAPTMNGYPVTYHNDWCGDHKVDENKIQQIVFEDANKSNVDEPGQRRMPGSQLGTTVGSGMSPS